MCFLETKNKPKIWLVLLFVPWLFSQCTKNAQINGDAENAFPSYFPARHYIATQYAPSLEGFNLGKLLFFEPILSSDSSISCGSCHFQSNAFSDAGKAVSVGVNGKVGKRNSPALFNLQWSKRFMWDGGVNHIEIMPLSPITDTNEMNSHWPILLSKFNANSQYRKLFKQVYNTETITDQLIYFSLAQYMSALVSSNSKWDKFVQNKITFSEHEKAGLALFNQHCNGCHTAPLFTNYEYENNGLASYNDPGRYRITLNNEDLNKFKVPSLRNIELTYPYMHDGSIASLKEVIDHYSDNINPHPNLSPLLSKPIKLSNTEKEDLYQFLLTLTDYEFINNEKFK